MTASSPAPAAFPVSPSRPRRAAPLATILLATAGLATAGLAGSLAGAGPALAQAASNACRAALTGSYLATITDTKAAYQSRSLVTLHGDGTVSVVDSRQYRGENKLAFSAQQGAWRCTGPRSATARTLDFGFATKETIGRLDWAIDVAGKDGGRNGEIRGTVTLRLFPGIEGIDPFGAGGDRVGSFRFSGSRIAPPR